MGASAKRKREKKQDFQKVKLKVGKTRPKATNFTDTSFRARSIILNQQSLTTTAPTANALFTHQLSLTSSKSDSQRRDALNSLTAALLAAHADHAPPPLPVATILPKIQPLVLDGSNSVRQQLLKLLRALPPTALPAHVDPLLLYVRAGLTHLSVEIRSSALDVLDWLLRAAGPAVVRCAGGWVKTLLCFMSLLGWADDHRSALAAPGPDAKAGAAAAPQAKWSSTRASFGKPGSAGSKLLVKQLTSLALFLETGFRTEGVDDVEAATATARLFPLWHVDAHMLPTASDPYGSLNLFGAPRDVESEMYDDVEGRKRVFAELAYDGVLRGVRVAKKEGGEVGRAAAALDKVLVQGMGAVEDGEAESP